MSELPGVRADPVRHGLHRPQVRPNDIETRITIMTLFFGFVLITCPWSRLSGRSPDSSFTSDELQSKPLLRIKS